MNTFLLILVCVAVLAAVAVPWLREARHDWLRHRQVETYRQTITRPDDHRLAGTDDGHRGDAPGAFEKD